MQEGNFTSLGPAHEAAEQADSSGEGGVVSAEDQLPNVFLADCPTRLLLDRIADKWSVLILTTLGTGEMRFNALKRRIDGISQKMLSQTLRTLERDGLISRQVVPTVPVTVSYAIMPLGLELLDALQAMIDWTQQRMPMVARAQAAYDMRTSYVANAAN